MIKASVYQFFFCLIFSIFFAGAQNGKLYDNIRKLDQKKQEDTTRLNLLLDIAWDYSYSNFDSGKYYAGEALLLARQLKNEHKLAEAYSTYGNCCRSLLRFDSALHYLSLSLQLYEKQNNTRKIAGMLQNIANVYNARRQFAEAIQKYKEALAYSRKAHYDLGQIVIITNMVGVYQQMGDYEKALGFAHEALEINKRLRDTSQYACLYSNMALILQGQKQYEKCLEYNKIALDYARSQHDKNTEGSVLFNMATVCKLKGNYPEAEQLFRQSIQVFDKLGDSVSIASNLHNLGNCFADQGNIDEALRYQLIAKGVYERQADSTYFGSTWLALAQLYSEKGKHREALLLGNQTLALAMSMGEMELIKSAFGGLSEFYKRAGDYKNALLYMEKANAIADSLFNQQVAIKTAFMQGELDLATKESKIELLKKSEELKTTELKRKSAMQYFLIGIIAFVMVFLGFALMAYRNKKKDNKIILSQKTEVEQQKLIIEEKNREILDSIHYARRIQGALLAGEELMTKNLRTTSGGGRRDYFILYKPKDIVSGDFYWATEVKKLRSGRMVFEKGQSAGVTDSDNLSKSLFALVTADCTGHGVPGAFMSLLNISFLNEAMNEKKITRPDQVLNHVRDNIIKALSTDGSREGGRDGMDAVCCLFDFETMKLQYAAANNGIYIIRKQTDGAGILIDLKPDKFPVGRHDRDKQPFSLNEFDLQPGDRIYTYTDGYADQFGGSKGKKFMYKQLQSLLLEHAEKALCQQKEILDETISTWMGNLEQVDDILIIGISV